MPAGGRLAGVNELTTLLRKLPNELRRQAIDSSLRAGVTVIRRRAIAHLSARLTSRSGDRRDVVAVKKRGQGSALRQAFIIGNNVNEPELHWLEFGTDPHEIRARRVESLVADSGSQFGEVVSHPGQPPRPWFRPAWDASRDEVLKVMAAKLGQGIVKAARKLGSGRFRRRILRGSVR